MSRLRRQMSYSASLSTWLVTSVCSRRECTHSTVSHGRTHARTRPTNQRPHDGERPSNDPNGRLQGPEAHDQSRQHGGLEGSLVGREDAQVRSPRGTEGLGRRKVRRRRRPTGSLRRGEGQVLHNHGRPPSSLRLPPRAGRRHRPGVQDAAAQVRRPQRGGPGATPRLPARAPTGRGPGPRLPRHGRLDEPL